MSKSTKKYPIYYESSSIDKFILKKANEKLIFNPSLLAYISTMPGPATILCRNNRKNYEGYISRKIAEATEYQ